MRKYKLSKDRLFIYICSLYLVGLIFGLFVIKGNNINYNPENSNFIKVFTSNYWYIFLMWLFGFSVIGLLFNSIIIFFRAFLFGVLISVLIPGDIKRLVVLILLELIIFLPAFFTLSYFSLGFSWNSFINLFRSFSSTINTKNYLNLIFIITIIIIIYSVIIIIY